MSRFNSKNMRKKSRKSSSMVPSFLSKLYEMLEVPNESISWSSDGNSFIVRNINEFSENVLPKFFKHNNFASFVRQLNMYDFHKIRLENQEHEFQHRLFKRGAKHLLSQIKRKITELSERVTRYNEQVHCTHTAEIQKLKRELSSSTKEIESLNNKVSQMEKLSGHLMKQNSQLISDYKSLINEISEKEGERENNMQKMIFAIFSMLNNGSITFTNKKNHNLSIQNNSSDFKAYSNGFLNTPTKGENTTVSIFGGNENSPNKGVYNLDDLAFQISSSLFGNNGSDKQSYLRKYLNQMSMKERENKKLLAKLGNLKPEDGLDHSELHQNISLPKKTGRSRSRVIPEREVPLQVMAEEEIIDKPKKKLKKEKTEEKPASLLPGNLLAENSSQNPSAEKLVLLDSPDPALISPFHSPRLSANAYKGDSDLKLCDSPLPNFFAEDLHTKDHHLPFGTEEPPHAEILDERIDSADIDSVDSSLHQGADGTERTFL